MGEQVTITVDRDDLDALVRFGDDAGYVYMPRVRAAIPAPPWEPNQAQIDAFKRSFDPSIRPSRQWAAERLLGMHAAGFDLSLRDQP